MKTLLCDTLRSCSSNEERYKALLAFGERLPTLCHDELIPENRISGCQSLMYLNFSFENGRYFFKAYSDALISKGIAYAVIEQFEGLGATEILTLRLEIFSDMGLLPLLSPMRSGGLTSLFTTIQKRVLLHQHHSIVNPKN